MWPYTCMILIFYSRLTPAVFFCDATMHIRLMMIQLHLSHTLFECETEFSNSAWQLQANIPCRLFGQRKILTLLSGHLDGDTQLLNLGTVPFTHIKAARTKCLRLQIKKAFLFEYLVYAISRINGFGLRIWNTVRKRGYSV